MASSSQEVVRVCNQVLRESGCRFSGGKPGRVIEWWIANVDQRGPVPKLQALTKLLEVSGMGFEYSDEAEKAFSVLWRMLTSRQDRLAAVQSALAVMRVFRTLPQGNDILDAARDEFLEATLRSMVPAESRCLVNARTYAVFVSYSRRDEPIVSAAVQLMRAVGAETFQDTDSIQPGEIWREVIFTTIESARSIIVFWSRNSAGSAAVRAEWTQGAHLNKRIIPVLLDSTPLDPDLVKYQWLDWRVFSVAGVEKSEQGTLREKLAQSSFPVDFLTAVTELMACIYTEDTL